MKLVIAAIRAGEKEIVALASVNRRGSGVSGEEKVSVSADDCRRRVTCEPDIGRGACRINDRIAARIDAVDAMVVDDEQIDA